MHGRDVVVTLANGTPAQFEMVQEALDRWWGPLMQMHGPRSDRAKDRDIFWRIKAKTSEELRQEFLGIYVPRIRELGSSDPGPGAEARRDRRGLALRRARLAGASNGRDEPRPEVAGTACVPAPQLGRHGLGPRGDPGSPEGSGVSEVAGVHGTYLAPGESETSLEPYEVFRQEKEGDPMRHGGSVMAPDPELALHYARELYGRRQESIRAVDRPPRRHRRARRP